MLGSTRWRSFDGHEKGQKRNMPGPLIQLGWAKPIRTMTDVARYVPQNVR